MKYNEFVKEIVKVVNGQLDSGLSASIQNVLKNNGLELEAIVIKKEEDTVVPNIYLEYYYQHFCEGESMEEVAEEIILAYKEALQNKPDHIGEYLNFEFSKDKVFYRIVNCEKNAHRLKNIPHIKKWDLAVTFHYLVQEDTSGMQSFAITDQIVKHWGTTVETIYDLAKENTPRLFLPKVMLLEQMIEELCTGNRYTDIKKKEAIYTDYLTETIENLPLSEGKNIFVLSNQNGINGASVILYPQLLEKISDKYQCDLYLLPSSIHEFLAVPAIDGEREQLMDMVSGVNQTEVEADEILSNTVYYYDREKKQILN